MRTRSAAILGISLAVVLAALLFASTSAKGSSFSTRFVGNEVVDLEWTVYADDDFSEYNISRNGEHLVSYNDRLNETSHRDTGLTLGERYTYEFKVIDSANETKETRSVSIYAGEVEGTLSLDTVWTQDLYNLTGELLVQKDVHLEIGENVTINTNQHHFDMRGTMNDLQWVNFQGTGLILDGDWLNTDDFTMKNCSFDGTRGGDEPGTALLVRDVHLSLFDITIANYEKGMIIEDDSFLAQDCSIQSVENTALNLQGDDFSLRRVELSNSGLGALIMGDDGSIKDCSFLDNTGNGLVAWLNDTLLFGNRAEENGGLGFWLSGDGLRIENSRLSNNSADGLMVENALDLVVTNCNLSGNGDRGMNLLSSENILVSGCELFDNIGWGNVYLESCVGTLLEDLTLGKAEAEVSVDGVYAVSCEEFSLNLSSVSSCDVGIFLKESNHSYLSENSFLGAKDKGIYVQDGWDVTVSDNTLTGDKVALLFNRVMYANITKNLVLDNTDSGMLFNGSSWLNIFQQNISSSGDRGIELALCEFVSMDEVLVEQCDWGLFIQDSSYVNFSQGQLKNNLRGLYAQDTSGKLKIQLSNISENEDGVHLFSASRVSLLNNTLWGNQKGIIMKSPEVGETSCKENFIDNNTLSNSQDGAIYLFRGEMNHFQNNTIQDTRGPGIKLDDSGNNSFLHNRVLRSSQEGIFVTNRDGGTDCSFLENTITGNGGAGIRLRAAQGFLIRSNNISSGDNDGLVGEDSFNCVVTWNNITMNRYNGIYFDGFPGETENHIVENNTLVSNEQSAIFLKNTAGCSIRSNHLLSNEIGIVLEDQSQNNKLVQNRIIGLEERESTSWDLMVAEEATGNLLKNFSLGKEFPTTVFIPSYQDGSFQFRGVDEPPEYPYPPEYDFKQRGINSFVEMSSGGNTVVFLEFHYLNEQLVYGQDNRIPEETLMVWRYGEPITSRGASRADEDKLWLRGDEPETVPWNGGRSLDTTKNIVGVEVRLFAIFAPLGGYPVHNLETDEDFPTIQAAMADEDTLDGHTLTLDAQYAGTKENTNINKAVLLRSTSGRAQDVTIVANSPSGNTLTITADGARIQNLTIAGSTEYRGIQVNGASGVEIVNCTLKDNLYGVGMENSQNIHIENCNFSGNGERDVYISQSTGCEILENEFSAPSGVYLNSASSCIIQDNNFRDSSNTGVTVYEGSLNLITGNDFQGGTQGFFIDRTRGNTFTGNNMSDFTGTLINMNKAQKNIISGASIEGGQILIYLDRSDKNTFGNIEFETWSPGELGGILLESSEKNQFQGMTMNFQAQNGGGTMGVSLSEESLHNRFHDIELIVEGGRRATGLEILGSNNSFQDVRVARMETSFQALGALVEDVEDIRLVNCSFSRIRTASESGIAIHFSKALVGTSLSDSMVLESDAGILCSNGSAPVIRWTQIIGNQYFGLENQDDEVTIDARHNWWGIRSGPAGEGEGKGDNVSAYVDFEPWISASFSEPMVKSFGAGTGSFDTRSLNGPLVEYSSSKNLTITVFPYETNPGTRFFGEMEKYVDLHLEDPNGVDEIILKLYYTQAELEDLDEADLAMHWWSGTHWLLCSESGVEITDTGDYAGYVWARVASDTAPSLNQLMGTPFAAGDAGFVTHTITVTVDEPTATIEPGAQIEISGELIVEPEATIESVKLYFDDVFSADATLETGRYSATMLFPETMEEGYHFIKAIVTLDTKENSSNELRFDYEPIQHAINISFNQPDGDIRPGGTLTLNGSIEVTPARDILSVGFFLDDTKLGDGTHTATSFSGSITLPGNLSEGYHSLSVEVTLDTEESERANKDIEYDPDTVDHEITIVINEISEMIGPGEDITISGTVTVSPDMPVDDIRVLLDNSFLDTAELEEGRFSIEITLPSDLEKGTHEISVEVTLDTGEDETQDLEFENKKAPSTGGGSDDGNGGLLILVLFLLLGAAVSAVIMLGRMGVSPFDELLEKTLPMLLEDKSSEEKSEEEEEEESEEEEAGEDKESDEEEVAEADEVEEVDESEPV